MQPLATIRLVAARSRESVVETPAFGTVVGSRRGDRHHALEPLQLSENQRAMRPGAVVSDVEVVAAGLGLETRRAVGADEAAELALGTHETPADHVRPSVGPFSVD